MSGYMPIVPRSNWDFCQMAEHLVLLISGYSSSLSAVAVDRDSIRWSQKWVENFSCISAREEHFRQVSLMQLRFTRTQFANFPFAKSDGIGLHKHIKEFY